MAIELLRETNLNAKSAARSLKTMRNEIDRIDLQVAALLARRMKLSEQIGNLKAQQLLSVHDEARENAVLESVAHAVDDERIRTHVLAIYQLILAQSRKFQEEISG